jgi:hypothetical protein
MKRLETSNEQPTRNRASQVPSLYLTFRTHVLETFSNKLDADILVEPGKKQPDSWWKNKKRHLNDHLQIHAVKEKVNDY